MAQHSEEYAAPALGLGRVNRHGLRHGLVNGLIEAQRIVEHLCVRLVRIPPEAAVSAANVGPCPSDFVIDCARVWDCSRSRAMESSTSGR